MRHSGRNHSNTAEKRHSRITNPHHPQMFWAFFSLTKKGLLPDCITWPKQQPIRILGGTAAVIIEGINSTDDQGHDF